MSAIFYEGDIALTTGRVKSATIYSNDLAGTKPPFTILSDNGCKYVDTYYSGYGVFPFEILNINDGLWIVKDKVPQGKFNEVYENQTTTWTKCIELSNGNYIAAKYAGTTQLSVGAFTSNGAQLFSTERAFGFGGASNETTYIGISVYVDEYGEAFANFILYSFRQMTTTQYHLLQAISFGGNVAGYNWISGSTPPALSWEPVEQLAGNSGQFRMNLAQVKEQYIGDGLTQDSTSDGSRFVISDMALLRTLTNNCAVGDEVTVAYCGRNYLTFTRDSSDPRSGIFKFYYYNGLLAYTSPLFVVNPGTTTFVYLCMYKDIVEHAVMMQIISYYVANDPYYTYNHLYDTYGATVPTDDDMLKLWIWLSDNGNIEEDINPYDTGTTDDGGDPGNPRPQDNIVDTTLPTLSGMESGIVTLYKPTAAQLTQISSFLWSNDVLDNFKKYFNNFADNILSLSIMPFTPSGLPTKLFKVGNMQSVDIGQVEYSSQRFYDISMGSVNINKLWGSYLDYSPYTKCEIYLPYLGLHSLDIDELMSPCKMDGSMPATQGCTLTLTYRLDLLTGVIVAKIAVTNEFITNQIRYQFSGKCGASIPLTGQTYAQMVQSMATIGAGLISTVATSGMAAPMIAGAAAVAATVQSQKPSVERIGNISGDASMLATNVPYIILSSPNKALLEKQEEFTGFPAYKSGTLQNFTGYCEVIEAHVEGITCTEEERAEILSLLKAGVII